MNGGGWSNLQPPNVSNYPPARPTLPPPFTGIISASITHNVHRWPPTTELVFVLPSLPEADNRNREDHRATIVVGTLHLQETVAALPKLLDQLGIPADAVGIVGRDDHTPEGPRVLYPGEGPDGATTGGPDIPPSRPNEDSIPPPPDTGTVETDANQDPGQSHTPAGTAEEAPHTLAGTPPESEAKASDTPPSRPDRGMYFILRLTQLIVRPDSRLGLLRYKIAPKCLLPGPIRSFRRRRESMGGGDGS